LLLVSLCSAQKPIVRSTITQVINQHLGGYALSSDNLLRLAIYAELKGKYGPAHRQILLDFGDFGEISFYENNCLIRTSEGVVNLNKGQDEDASLANEMVHNLLENLMLFSNQQADTAHLAFVDKYLAKKNIEPFHKIYTRHVLLRFGKYHAGEKKVVFHTDYISPSTPYSGNMVQKHKTPLKLVLDSTELRGYYLHTGGEVFVHDSKQNLWYATEEGKKYNNVTAYKLFIQLLITESIPYISQEESLRQQKLDQLRQLTYAGNASSSLPSRYSPDEWIMLMLTSLRNQNISPADPYILKHLVRQPYFSRIYEHMTETEKTEAKRYQSYGWYLAN